MANIAGLVRVATDDDVMLKPSTLRAQRDERRGSGARVVAVVDEEAHSVYRHACARRKPVGWTPLVVSVAANRCDWRNLTQLIEERSERKSRGGWAAVADITRVDYVRDARFTDRFAHTSVEETMGIGQHADHGHWQLSIHWRRVGVGVGSVTVLRRVGYSLG